MNFYQLVFVEEREGGYLHWSIARWCYWWSLWCRISSVLFILWLRLHIAAGIIAPREVSPWQVQIKQGCFFKIYIASLKLYEVYWSPNGGSIAWKCSKLVTFEGSMQVQVQPWAEHGRQEGMVQEREPESNHHLLCACAYLRQNWCSLLRSRLHTQASQ